MSNTKIDGLLLKKMIIAGANKLQENKALVDSLNVFPVPDGDTGTNMSLTALAAAKECQKSNTEDLSEMANLAVNGSLRGARGNSGVILSQLYRGFQKGLNGKSSATTKDIAEAFKKSVITAYKAVMKPKEGTILTVAKSAAISAEKHSNIKEIDEFLKAVIKDANEVLLKTPDMLPVLKQAGVVDAGGKGLIFILEGAYESLSIEGDIIVSDEKQKEQPQNAAAAMELAPEDITFGYCTEFFINVKNSTDEMVNDLKAYLETIGDSIVAVNNEDIIKIHVHTDHPGTVLEKALSIGSLSGLKIENMREQHSTLIKFSQEELEENTSSDEDIEEDLGEEKEVGFVTVCAGKGLIEIFKSLGADKIIEGGQTMNPSTEDILNAINKTNAKNVIVLPNNKNIILAANQAAEIITDKKVFVLSTKTVPEGISAMLNFEGFNNIEDAVEEAVDSFSQVKTLMVTYAVRDTVIDDKTIEKGDVLAMVGSKIAKTGKDLQEVTKAVLDDIITEDNDMVSVYYGSDTTNEAAEEIGSYIEEKFVDCEVEICDGGQPLYYYIISVE